jgi:hypothetical protein
VSRGRRSPLTLVGFCGPSRLRYNRLIGAFMHHKELLDGLIEHVVVLKTFADESIAKEFVKIGVIRPVVKTQVTDVLEVGCDLLWEGSIKFLD